MKTLKDPFIQGCLLICAVVLSLLAWLSNGPNTVSIDAKHWMCTSAEPNGIKTRCTQYNYYGEKGK